MKFDFGYMCPKCEIVILAEGMDVTHGEFQSTAKCFVCEEETNLFNWEQVRVPILNRK